jgi:hypothetical protein
MAANTRRLFIAFVICLSIGGCAHKPKAPLTLDQMHAAYNKPPPECAQLLMQCTKRWYCTPQLEARMYLFRVYRWQDCESDFRQWEKKRHEILAQLRTLDPAPACFHLPENINLDYLEIERSHPFARELVIARGASSGDAGCNEEMRAWRMRWGFYYPWETRSDDKRS